MSYKVLLIAVTNLSARPNNSINSLTAFAGTHTHGAAAALCPTCLRPLLKSSVLMKQIASILILFFISHHVWADDPDELYVSLTGLYWFVNKKLPKSIEKINKSLGFDLPTNATQASYEEWLNKVNLELKRNGIIVTSYSDGIEESSKVKCESVSYGE